MRTVQTFVLRLLVDTADPQALHGTVQAVTDGETRPFADQEALLSLLRGMNQSVSNPASDERSERGEDG